jgi:hypothetical protein
MDGLIWRAFPVLKFWVGKGGKNEGGGRKFEKLG